MRFISIYLYNYGRMSACFFFLISLCTTWIEDKKKKCILINKNILHRTINQIIKEYDKKKKKILADYYVLIITLIVVNNCHIIKIYVDKIWSDRGLLNSRISQTSISRCRMNENGIPSRSVQIPVRVGSSYTCHSQRCYIIFIFFLNLLHILSIRFAIARVIKITTYRKRILSTQN